MSMPFDNICCTGCDFETRYLPKPIHIVYRWPSGKEFETRHSIGWCYDCDDYRDIENMDPECLRNEVSEKERERSEYRRRSAELPKGFLAWVGDYWSPPWKARKVRYEFKFGMRLPIQDFEETRRTLRYKIKCLDKEIKETEKLLDIATQRNSRSRCLTCGSDKTAPATFGRDDNLTHDFKHACGGMLQRVTDRSLRISCRLITYVLNTEGVLLEEFVA